MARKVILGCLAAVGALVVICAVIALFMAVGANDQPQTRSTINQKAMTISAIELNAAYTANEPAADEKYADRPLKVFGRVKSIEKDAWGATYITMSDGSAFISGSLLGVRATMNDDEATRTLAPQLYRGEPVVVLCTKTQRIIGFVTLSNCEFTTYSDDSQSAPHPTAEPVTPPPQKQTYTDSEARKLYFLMDKNYRDHPGDGEGSRAQPPRLLSSVSPVYPTDAWAAHISGTVTVGATVDADGKLVNIHVIKSASPSLDTAALQAFSQYQFEPAHNSITGAATTSSVTQDLSFPAH